MANTLLTPSTIARESALVLQNNLVNAGLVYRDLDQSLGAKVGDTITVRKPATFVAQEFSGTISIQNAVEGSVAVKLDTILDVSFEVTAKDLTLSVPDFSQQFLQPAMAAIAQGIDVAIAKRYVDIPYYAEVGGTAAVSDIAALDKVLNINKAPQSGRALVLSPQEKATYSVLDAFLHAEKHETAETVKEAQLGRVLGFDTYMSQNVQSHTKGDLAANATLTGTAGATTGTIASGGNAKKAKKGDVFTISGLTEAAPANQYVVTEELTTAADGSGTLKFYPALPSNVSGAQITLKASKRYNMAFHRNAFVLACRPLEKPMGGTLGDVVSYKGLSLRVTYDYTMTSKTNVISVDLLCGTATLQPELAVRFAA